MKLKRIVAVILALMMLFALAACGKEKSEEKAENSKSTASDFSEVTEAQAEQLAETYVTEGTGVYFILKEVASVKPTTNSISVPSVGSVDISSDPVTIDLETMDIEYYGLTEEDDDDEYYEVTVKGTTSAYDDYGNFIKSFKFKYTVYVRTEVYGELTETSGINSNYVSVRCW